MLTFERQQLILSILEEKKVVKLQELVDRTGASESTIRRDLTELEDKKLLKRVHGGASLINKKLEEPTIAEKTSKFSDEKQSIGEYAASFVKDGDCIFIDAGTTTKAMVQHLQGKDIVVVTNGVNIIHELLSYNIRTYVVGGYVKSGTHALVGRGAIDSLLTYQFDKAFIGTNGLDIESGYTTPDPEEAQVKGLAMEKSNKAFVLADHSKFGDTAFSKIKDIEKATIITSALVDEEIVKAYRSKTDVKVADIS